MSQFFDGLNDDAKRERDSLVSSTKEDQVSITINTSKMEETGKIEHYLPENAHDSAMSVCLGVQGRK